MFIDFPILQDESEDSDHDESHNEEEDEEDKKLKVINEFVGMIKDKVSKQRRLSGHKLSNSHIAQYEKRFLPLHAWIFSIYCIIHKWTKRM